MRVCTCIYILHVLYVLYVLYVLCVLQWDVNMVLGLGRDWLSLACELLQLISLIETTYGTNRNSLFQILTLKDHRVIE